MLTSPDVPWERDELILALDLYNRHGVQPPTERAAALSRDLRDYLTLRDGGTPEPKVRSTTGVSDKLSGFEALRLKKETSRGGSALMTDVWSEFGRDSKRIWTEVQQIRERRVTDASA